MINDDVGKGTKVLCLGEVSVEYIQYVPLRYQDRTVGGIYLPYLLKVAGERSFKLYGSWVARCDDGVVD